MPATYDHDPQAEMAVLGAIIMSRGAVLDDLDGFQPGDYHRLQHEELHRKLAARHKAHEPIDETIAQNVCASVQGLHPSYVLDCIRACVVPALGAHYAGIVSRLAALRQARNIGYALANLDVAAAEDADSLERALDLRRDQLAQIGTARAAEITTFADVAEAAIRSIGQQVYTPTPWEGLNHLIRGWSPACMYGLGARPGTGKTVLTVQAAVEAARRGLGVAYYTFEMSGPRLYLRALAGAAGVDLKKINEDRLTASDWSKLREADHGYLRKLPIVCEGAAGWTAQQVVSHAKQAHRRHPLGLIIVDHIGRVVPDASRKQNAEQDIADASNRFLDMAHTLNSAVVTVTQLNRENTKRSDPRPVASDVRGSDVIEQNCDVLMLLHRDREKSPDDLDLLVAKNRDGVDGPVKLTFEGHVSRISDREWRAA